MMQLSTKPHDLCRKPVFFQIITWSIGIKTLVIDALYHYMEDLQYCIMIFCLGSSYHLLAFDLQRSSIQGIINELYHFGLN